MSRLRFRRVSAVAMLVLVLWIAADLLWPVRVDLAGFDPAEVGRLDASMWRSSCERKPVELYFQLATLMRRQFHAPFLRSHLIAFLRERPSPSRIGWSSSSSSSRAGRRCQPP